MYAGRAMHSNWVCAIAGGNGASSFICNMFAIRPPGATSACPMRTR